jgi:hypothetical protein
MSKGFISKNEIPTPEKGIRDKEKGEEFGRRGFMLLMLRVLPLVI